MRNYLFFLALYAACGLVYVFLSSKEGVYLSVLNKYFFCAFNLVFTYLIFLAPQEVNFLYYVLYIALIILFYVVLRMFSSAKHRLYGFAFFLPIMWMIATKVWHWSIFLGVSYMAFRLSYLVFEIHAKKVSMPSFVDYLSFSFFTPTFLMGPINPYQYYSESIANPDRSVTPIFTSISRVIVGAVKCIVLANFVNQLGFKGLWFDHYYYYTHGIPDFLLCSIMSYLYIYLNFSGYSDIAIGVSGILNIRVKENFNYPLTAPNMIELWRRWHISLAEYFRDIFFMPCLLALTRIPFKINIVHLTAFVSFMTFVLNGLWHGLTVNFIIIGILNGVGIVTVHYYDFLVKKLPHPMKDFLNHNRYVRYCSILITFLYFSVVCFFFSVSDQQMKIVFEVLSR